MVLFVCHQLLYIEFVFIFLHSKDGGKSLFSKKNFFLIDSVFKKNIWKPI